MKDRNIIKTNKQNVNTAQSDYILNLAQKVSKEQNIPLKEATEKVKILLKQRGLLK